MADETSVVAQIFDSLEVSLFLKKLLFPLVEEHAPDGETTRIFVHRNGARALWAQVTRPSGDTENHRLTGSFDGTMGLRSGF
jgi:hypothetical protein